jgi:shikimate dehydrogenase
MTDRYAVVGNPVSHSKSPLIHSTFARQTGQDLHYGLIETDNFKDAIDRFRAEGGRGVNVTTPFKLDAFAYATDRHERAQLAGAVNCMKFEGDQAIAENYDGVGLVNDIQRNQGFPMKGRRVLVLGAGGAARGMMLPFLETEPAVLFIVNRTVSKAIALAETFSRYGNVVAGGYDDLRGEAFDVVVNATSTSLKGELPPVTAAAFGKDCLAYDLVYGRGLTPFLRFAKEGGRARAIADGVGMLVEQAAEAFQWWRGVRPDTRRLIGQLTVPLA